MDGSPRTSARIRYGASVAAVAALVTLGGLWVTGALAGSLGGAPRFHGTAWEPPEPATDFRLTEHTGRTVSLSDHRGKGVLLFFGYASCPDVCPLTLAKLQRVLKGMGADTSEVGVLLVTVDPENDTPEALARYVERFAPHVSGLTGDAQRLSEIRKSYYAYAEPAQAEPAAAGAHEAHHTVPQGDFSHSPQVFGIDRAGRIRVLLPMEQPEEAIAEDIRTLLRM